MLNQKGHIYGIYHWVWALSVLFQREFLIQAGQIRDTCNLLYILNYRIHLKSYMGIFSKNYYNSKLDDTVNSNNYNKLYTNYGNRKGFINVVISFKDHESIQR